MSEEEQTPAPIEDEEPEETPGYKPPAQKTLDEIQNLDADDESLVKYKQTLLGNAAAAKGDGPNVVVQKMTLVVDGRPDIEIDLTGDLTKLKDSPFVLKEGAPYRLRITFMVNNEIVAGLKYLQVTSRKGVRVDKESYMVGSYGPKPEPQSYMTPIEEAPRGLIARGSYMAKSKFLDDDKNVHLEWEWAFHIKKDWE